jgi:AbrB family looped-hinge helix DNA binding protein
MKGVKSMKIMIQENLTYLRKSFKYSQEEVAEKIGVSRQAIAKWESGETLPDIINCVALADLYDVELNDLLHHDPKAEGLEIGPRGKHIMGIVTLQERGQVVLPKDTRDMFDLVAGDKLVVFTDENPESAGIALVPTKYLNHLTTIITKFDKQSRGDE